MITQTGNLKIYKEILMVMTYNPLSYLIENIVDQVRLNYAEEKVLPYFDFGVTLEVVNRLKLKTESDLFYDKKYPLVWHLINGNVSEKVDYSKTNPREAQDVTIIICTQTSNDYTSRDRYENTFIPTLRPIYDLFMYYLRKSKELKSTDNYTHSYSENLFWGREGLYGHEGNIFDDRIDAIIIDNLKLRVIESCN